MSGPVEHLAELRVATRSGELFLADELEISSTRVVATGRWARPVGAHWRGRLLRPRESYSWATTQVAQIRYVGDAGEEGRA